MAVVQRDKLRELIKKILSRAKVEDLKLIIKGPEVPSSEIKVQPEIPDRRKNPPGGEFGVSSPEKRLILPASRSLRDHWTVIYKNIVVIRGEFHEIQHTIADATHKVVSYPHLIAKHFSFYTGIVLIIAVVFLAMIGFSRFITNKQNLTVTATPTYKNDFDALNKSLSNVVERQEVIKSVLSSVAGQLKEERTKEKENVDVKEEPSPPKEESLGEKFNKGEMEFDLSQLANLKNMKSELLLKDKELDRRGLTPLHWERKAIQASIEALDQQMEEIRLKYNIKPSQQE
jgi:hypothetical protein